MLYGSGMQTWEYSPVYALRSYAYLGLHALPMAALRLCGLTNKVRASTAAALRMHSRGHYAAAPRPKAATLRAHHPPLSTHTRALTARTSRVHSPP